MYQDAQHENEGWRTASLTTQRISYKGKQRKRAKGKAEDVSSW